ncbi:MAG: amidase family protein [Pigmentiphaga sp.]|nr:amidase family protein [Pigmentiphaga sp.]
MSALQYLSISDLVEGYSRKQFSPVDVLAAQLQRISDFNGQVNAFTLLQAEQAKKAAQASERRWLAGQPAGPLDGVTFTAKDNLLVEGLPSRRGSRAWSDAPVSETAPAVQRCLEAGAVFLGLTTMPELGAGPVTISPLTGVTTNPWDTSKQAGGSSGGGAASVAAGFCTFALGTDAGGSLRIPAALTGVVGFKATGGLVPMYPPNVAGGLSCAGPLARSVREAAQVMDRITLPDPRDAMTLPWRRQQYVSALETSLRGKRFAMSLTLGYAPKVEPEVEAAFRSVGALLTDLGAAVEEVDPGVENPIDAYLVLLQAGYRYALRTLSAAQRELLSPTMQDILLSAKEVTLEDYMDAQAYCQQLARKMQAFHQRHDFLLTPTVACAAFDANRTYPEAFEAFPNRRAWTPYTSLFNLTQQPAVSLPMGLTETGLPMGLHLSALRGEDEAVLQAAHALENVLGFAARPRLQTA